MDNINLFSRIPADVNKYICSFLPEKDYGLYTLISKNFCNQLWPQYLIKRNIQVIGNGKAQVLKNVRSFCNLLLNQKSLKNYINPWPSSAFEAKETLKELAVGNEDVSKKINNAYWNILLDRQKIYLIFEEAVQSLLEFDGKSLSTAYLLFKNEYMNQPNDYPVKRELFKVFLTQLIKASSVSQNISNLKDALEKNKFLAVGMFLANAEDLEPEILTLALTKGIDLIAIKRILEKTKSCNYVNLLAAMASGYREEISLEIIKKLRLSKDIEITPDLLKEAARREFSKDMIGYIKHIHAHITSLSKFNFESLLDAHERELKKNQTSWLSEDCSKGILIKLLTQQIDWKTFYRYHEYSTLSVCYAKSSRLVKESLLKKFPLVAYNFNLDQFLLAESASQNNKNFVLSDLPLAGLDAMAGCNALTIREILFFDKERKKIEIKFNSEKITVFSSNNKFQKTFERHEKLQKEHNLHSFIATWIDPTNFKQRASEAASFMNHKNDIPFKIYRSSKKENEYSYYCDQDFEENPKPMAKFNASDLSLDSEYRGSQRAYLAGYYEEQASYFEELSASIDQTAENNLECLYTAIRYFQKAKFWYEKAVEDKHIDSCLTLMSWYDVGNLITKPSIKMSIMYINSAAHAVLDTDERAFQILSSYLKVLNINLFVEDREANIDYCKKRLAALTHD